MDCCVCWAPLTEERLVSFARVNGCHPSHGMCLSCYTQVRGCPLCRFSPYEGSDYDGRHLLQFIHNQKRPLLDIIYVKNELNKLQA